jgi:hypothetical protein
MTPFERFRERQIQKLIEGWPPEAVPEGFDLLTRKEFTDIIRTSIWSEGIPAAEMTPFLLLLRRLHQEYTRLSYEAFVKLGSILLEIQKRYPNDGEFWKYAEANVRFGNRTNARWAMEAASVTNHV